MNKKENGVVFDEIIASGKDRDRKGLRLADYSMTLRDYFAGQALCGLLAKYNLNAPSDQGTIAQMSYELADAMLAERGKE